MVKNSIKVLYEQRLLKVHVETLYDILYECIEENVDIQNVYSKIYKEHFWKHFLLEEKHCYEQCYFMRI